MHLVKGFNELESRLEEKENPEEDHEPKSGAANRNHISTTDPDASVTRQGGGKRNLQYKAHRSVDGKAEVITATEITPGEVNEAHLLSTLLAMHQDNTQTTAETVVADTKYGTADNYLACCDLGVKAHIPDLKKSHNDFQGIFHEDDFHYHPETDSYLCPAGNYLKRSSYKPNRDVYEYRCSNKACRNCSLVTPCTKSKIAGRSPGAGGRKTWTRCEALRKLRHPNKTSVSVSILWSGRLRGQRDMDSSGRVGEDFGGFSRRFIFPNPLIL
ncbi:MAG TPA: hypothetical protein DDX93_02690 [Smithella sp.]|nr:hypothetical protein [Smithella sp.]